MKPPPDYVTDRRARRDAWPDLSADWLDDERDVSEYVVSATFEAVKPTR